MTTRHNRAFTRPVQDDREKGFSLIELMVSLSMLTVGVLGFLGSFYSGFKAVDTLTTHDEAQMALENVAELLRGAEFTELYTTHHGTSVTVPGLEDPDGGAASVEVKCYVDELDLPDEFGPIYDLDGEGGLDKSDVSSIYRLLPIRLRIDYKDGDGSDTRVVYMVIAENA